MIRIRVTHFSAARERGEITVDLGNEKIKSTVGFETSPESVHIRMFHIESDRLQEVVAHCGFGKELLADCDAALRGDRRPLPWDYGEYPAEMIPPLRTVRGKAARGPFG